MEDQKFKQQQEDRIEEGKDLKREDELTDLSKISGKELQGADKKSLFSKIGETISNAATTIADKISGVPAVEGHEELDRDVRKQVKKINKEIQERGVEGTPEPVEWEKGLTKKAHEEAAGAKDQAEGFAKKLSGKIDEVKDSGDLSSKTTIQPNREGPSSLDKINKESSSLLGKIQHGLSNVGENLKQKFTTDKEEERHEDGTKTFKKVEDGFKESVDDLKQQKRIEELGQEELASQNPFKVLDSGSENKEEGETRTLGEKIKGGLNDASSKINQKVKGVFEKAPQDKENTQQTA